MMTMPRDAMVCYAMLRNALLCHAVPCRATESEEDERREERRVHGVCTSSGSSEDHMQFVHAPSRFFLTAEPVKNRTLSAGPVGDARPFVFAIDMRTRANVGGEVASLVPHREE